MTGSRSLAVIVPMFNEERNAERCVSAILPVLSRELPSARLFVVNDGSTDGTDAILRGLLAGGMDFQYVPCERNQGYGAALVAGARAALGAGYEFGLFMDSDLTNDPALIPRFAERLAGGDLDLLKASRYVPGGGMEGVPLRRQLPSRLGNWLAARLFGMGLHDLTNGFRAVRLSMIADVQFRERGFPQILEEMVELKRRGARVAELPYVLTSRTDPEASSKFSYRPAVVLRYLKYAVQAARVPYRPRAG
jgi:dolichol-phosphate mannosyltransferase